MSDPLATCLQVRLSAAQSPARMPPAFSAQLPLHTKGALHCLLRRSLRLVTALEPPPRQQGSCLSNTQPSLEGQWAW